MTNGPLQGIRVLDLGRLMPSSIASAELAALGAEVIKVEVPPHGDYVRVNPPVIHERGDMHLAINRGKKSVCIDLRCAAGRAVFDRLVAASDVLIELSRPGSGAALGLDPERLQGINPALVHCSITGFGHTGPYSRLGAHGLSADAAAGLLTLEREGDRWLLPKSYVSVGPRASGYYAAIAILGALFEARATGKGAFIDVSQWDAAVGWNYRNLTLLANDQGLTPAYRDLGPRYDVYETSDHRWILLCVPEPKLWRAFCSAIDRPDLASDVSDVAIEYVHDEHLAAELRAEFLQHTRDEWIELGVTTGLPLAPVVPADELPDDPHVGARDMLLKEPHPLGGDVRLPGQPIKAGWSVDLSPAPELGEDSVAVLESIGCDPDEIQRLLNEGVVQQSS